MREHARGNVVVGLLIDTDGSVQPDEVIGCDAPPAILVADAVRQWRYAPARLGNEPVMVFMTAHLSFQLDGR